MAELHAHPFDLDPIHRDRDHLTPNPHATPRQGKVRFATSQAIILSLGWQSRKSCLVIGTQGSICSVTDVKRSRDEGAIGLRQPQGSAQQRLEGVAPCRMSIVPTVTRSTLLAVQPRTPRRATNGHCAEGPTVSQRPWGGGRGRVAFSVVTQTQGRRRDLLRSTDPFARHGCVWLIEVC